MKAARKIKRGVAVLQPEIKEPVVRNAGARWWHYALGALAVYICAFLVYSPSLHGEFVFDDMHMPFVDPNAPGWPLSLWWGVRPLLMTTFWANLHFSGIKNTLPYHAFNVFFHASAAILVFFAARKILEFARVESGKGALLAGFAAGVFLLHPIQTEAVSYVAQRGEDLGAIFYFAAFCVFLYRKPGPVSWITTVCILLLFGAAVTTKEHTVTFPALLLLTDYFFNPGFTFEGFTFEAVKRNWRLYSVIALGSAAGVAFLWRYLSRDTTSIGFQLPEFTPAQYLFTQFRVFFAYIGLFLYPLWQTIDYDFPVSRTLLDHGAIIALAIILLLTVAAFRLRRRFPLAVYGFFVFVLLLLPTSSIIPIRDPIADRRLYLPMIGLLLIALEFLRRWNISRQAMIAVCSAVCLLLAIGSYQRNEKWSNALALWSDAAEKSPGKSRVQFGLAVSEFLKGHCHDSIEHYQKAISLSKPDFQYYMNLGMAYDCDHQSEKALEALRRSLEVKPTAQTWAAIALIELKQGQFEEPLAALQKAEALDPNYPMTYVYRGGIYQAANRTPEALEQFHRALALDPSNATAKAALATLQR